MKDNRNQPPPSPTAGIYNLNTKRGRSAKRAADRRLREANKAANRAAHQAELEQRRLTKRNNRCTARTKTNLPCRRTALKDGLCFIHSKSEQEQKALMAQARLIRKQHQLKPHELMRTVIESNPIIFMQPYLDALGVRIVFVPDSNDPSILHPTAIADPTSNGATLYGISKDGHVIISKVKDMEAQQRAAERLFDRVYGKPKQTNIIAGASTNQDPAIVPFDEKRQAEVAAILHAASKPSHQTHQNPLNNITNPTSNPSNNN